MLRRRLRGGLIQPDRNGIPIGYRLLQPGDDVDAITALLHRACAPLAAAGMRHVASHQAPDVARRRMARGDTVVALADARIVGVITLSAVEATKDVPFYDRPDAASFGQFAVEPDLQGRGIGGSLLTMVEDLARERRVGIPALDTSEHAIGLIRFYQARGYSSSSCPVAACELSKRHSRQDSVAAAGNTWPKRGV